MQSYTFLDLGDQHLSKAVVILLVGRCLFAASFSRADTSSWIGPDSDFDTATNWSNGVPTDIAEFNTSTPLSLSFSRMNSVFNSNDNSTSLNGFHFNQGA